MSLILESCSEGLCLLLVSWLAQKSEHVLLVSLNARLIKRIHTENITADTASLLEEIEEGSEVVLVDALDAERELRHTTVDVSELCSELCHRVALLNMLACEEVKAVKVLRIILDKHRALALLYCNHSLHEGALTVLDVLAHRVKVCCEVD